MLRGMIAGEFAAHREALLRTEEVLSGGIEAAAGVVVGALRGGNKILFCGNGGSASDAQHLAAELSGRYIADRVPLPGIALSTDTSALTAIANDYGFDEVFARQVRAHARPGDVLVGISTSGNSANVRRAVEAAKELGCLTIGLLGRDGGKLAARVHHPLVVPASATARIQEMHILIGHLFCQAVEDAYLPNQKGWSTP